MDQDQNYRFELSCNKCGFVKRFPTLPLAAQCGFREFIDTDHDGVAYIRDLMAPFGKTRVWAVTRYGVVPVMTKPVETTREAVEALT